MKDWPIVSVIIPVCSDSLRIQILLDHLNEQTYPEASHEVIVIDNNSKDDTFQVLRDYSNRTRGLVRLTSEKEIQSPYAARNAGIRIAKGEILAFTDSDCIPHRDWIEKGCQSFRDPGVSFAAGRIDMIFKQKRPNIWEYFDAVRKLNQRAYVEKAGFGATANLFVRRKLFHKYGMFRADLQSGGDYEFGRRLTKAGEKLVYVDSAVVRHPARRSFKAVLSKSKRVAKGQKQLEDMGLLEHYSLSWQRLKPVRQCPRMDAILLNAKQRLAIVAMANFFKYYNFLKRL